MSENYFTYHIPIILRIENWRGARYCHMFFLHSIIPVRNNAQNRYHNSFMNFVHYDDVIMGTIASQITSLTSVYSIVYSGADQSKHQSSASLAFVWGIHRDRWIPRTNGQLRGKCFHLMTSSWNTLKSRARMVPMPQEYCFLSTHLPLAFKSRISELLLLL